MSSQAYGNENFDVDIIALLHNHLRNKGRILFYCIKGDTNSKLLIITEEIYSVIPVLVDLASVTYG